ncbi:MAG TPA: FAD-dependent oxidoreductase, partial [Planctomycetota bacterium]|nr:FAD-dependent oxidoreductase [Planctomycetota bacterium]
MKLSRGRVAWIVGLAATLLLAVIARPFVHLAWTAWNDVDRRETPPAGTLDDASRLNRTTVAEVWSMPPDESEAERGLVDLLGRARRDGRKVAIAGARHSMGGQTLFPDGIVVDLLKHDRFELDERHEILRAQAGARWSEILPYLDARGRSIGVMQSNNSFTVGGSVSVNCHGWSYGCPPIASTVESFRLM